LSDPDVAKRDVDDEGREDDREDGRKDDRKASTVRGRRTPARGPMLVVGALVVAAVAVASWTWFLPVERPSALTADARRQVGQAVSSADAAAAGIVLADVRAEVTGSLRSDEVRARATETIDRLRAAVASLERSERVPADELDARLDELARLLRAGDPAVGEALVALERAVALVQPAPGAEGADLAAVRILRVGPAAETLDVWLDERRIVSGLGLGRPSEYVVVPAGRHELAVASPAGDAPGPVPPTALGSVALAPGGYATVVVPAPASADGGGASEPESAATPPFVVDDPLRELPPAGNASLRLVHAAAGRPALTLAVRDADAPTGGPPPGLVDPPDVTLYVGRAAPMRGSGYTTIDAGGYRLWFVGEDGGQVLSEPVVLEMRPGALYTVFLSGSRSGEARVVVSVDATTVAPTQSDGSGAASLRLLHASPDAPLVDLLVDGRLTLRNVKARIPTASEVVSPGWHRVELFPHRLPGPLRLPGDGGATEDAEADDSSSAASAASTTSTTSTPSGSDGAAEPAGRSEPPRLEPVTAYVDVRPLAYTMLVLTGRFDPPPEGSTPGALSVAVEPADAVVVVQGPGGGVASSPGPKLLDELGPGTYRIEVRKEGYRTARYEVDVRSEGTVVVNVTLQSAPAGGEAVSGDAAGNGEATENGAPTFMQDSSVQAGRRRLELHVFAGAIPTPGPGRARVRFVHVAPSVPPLEIVATRGEGGQDEGESTDETLRIERLAYPNASPYLSVPAESQTLTFRVSGSQNRIRGVDGLNVRPGVSYTLYLVERESRLEFAVVPVVDAIAPQRGPERGSSR